MSKYVTWWGKSSESVSSKEIILLAVFILLLLALFASADLSGNPILLDIKNNFGYFLIGILLIVIVINKIKGKK